MTSQITYLASISRHQGSLDHAAFHASELRAARPARSPLIARGAAALAVLCAGASVALSACGPSGTVAVSPRQHTTTQAQGPFHPPTVGPPRYGPERLPAPAPPRPPR